METRKGLCVIVMLAVIVVCMMSFNSCSKNYVDNVEVVEGQPIKIWANPETPASFPGGAEAMFKFIKDNLRYPEEYGETCIQGRVIVTFIIEKDGSMTDVKVLRELDPKLDEEAMRVVRMMPKWTPATYKGNYVRSRYTVPVDFRLE